DLCFVVAVAQAASSYHHELVEGHIADGLIGFGMGFFAVWWGWMNFTWFASAHDTDDVTHRVLTLIQMAGALVLAAGISRAVERSEFEVVVIGYLIMRIGLLASWLRVAAHDDDGRRRALRYAGGIAAVQVLWVGRLVLPDGVQLGSFVILALAEMAIPLWAEQALDRPLFHPHHIEARYGLFTIIVLGESILSATVGFQGAVEAGGLTSELAAIGVGGLVLAFGLWWLYFDHPGHLSPTPGQSFRWGYAHVVVFASLAALGAGVFVAAEAAGHHASARTGALAVALPVAAFLLGLVLIMVLTGTNVGDVRAWPKATAAVVVVVVGLVAPVVAAVVFCAVVVIAMVVWMIAAGDDPDAVELVGS
ncbi:MAG TPA: low temperature requirement protein A, partial [Iamia sp.]|nr:low temperature requirement protein A [Iamia sp.]